MKAPRPDTASAARSRVPALACALALFAALLFAPPSLRAQAPAQPTPEPSNASTPPGAGVQAPRQSVTSGVTNAQKPARPAPAPLAGRVVGEGGEPIAGVTVYAGTRTQTGGPRAPNVVTSDEAGNFVFPALEPGLYVVSANQPGYVAESDPQTGQNLNTFRPGDQAVVRLVKGGIVTGSVVDPLGTPLVGLGVRAILVRDLNGKATQGLYSVSAEDRTDDRGVYRIYGLRPGMYIVVATGSASYAFGSASAYAGDVPTFYPSGTSDTAAEIAVRAGQETSGIDIRYRDEQGRRVTGTVELPAGFQTEFGVGVTLTYAGTEMPAGSVGVGAAASAARSFSIEGIADGEYDIRAQGGGREGMLASSAPQRITVRGADVTGVRLMLAPLASVAGTLRIEPATEAERLREPCKAVRSAPLPQETFVAATPERASGAAGAARPSSRFLSTRTTAPEQNGDFLIRSLEPARYRVSVRPFDESLYVRSVALPGAAPNAPAAAREVFDLKPGQQLAGIIIRLTEGAGTLGGRVAMAEDASPQTPPPTRVHLVPQERERAEDTLRYHEASVAPDGAFSLKNLAPGRYLLLARAEAEPAEGPRRAAAWDADTRARLRREAEAAATPVEIQPCQRTGDYVLKFPQTK